MVAEDRDEFIDLIARELREPVRLGADFDARVMASLDVDVIPLRPARTKSRSWFMRPRLVAISPLTGLAAAAAITVIAVLGARAIATGGSPAPVASVESASSPMTFASNSGPISVPVEPTSFIYQNGNARSVHLVGDFNDWDATRTPLLQVAPGVWTALLPLPAGRYHYQLVLDGQQRVTDPSAKQQVESDFGGENSVIVVGGGAP